MKVFLDTNILVDFVEQRDNLQYAKAIFELGLTGDLDLYASYLTFANLAFILRHRTKEERYNLMRTVREMVTVIDNTAVQLDNALGREVKDFEDLLQYCCALSGGCDLIITNNKKDFAEFCLMPFFTSTEFLINYLRNKENAE